MHVGGKSGVAGTKGGVSGAGVGVAHPQVPVQYFLEYSVLVYEAGGEFRQHRDVSAFAAETKGVHDAQPVKQGNGSRGKIFRAAECIINRQLQHEIGSVLKRGLRAQIFVGHGRCAALHEVSAHGNDAVVGTGHFFCFGDLMGMSVVKWIVLCDDTCCSHSRSPLLYLKSHAFNGFLIY